LRADAALASVTTPPLRVGDPIRGQDFDRHLAVEPGIARAIHLAHTARAQWGEDLVWA
jgi:hypothetical protein